MSKPIFIKLKLLNSLNMVVAIDKISHFHATDNGTMMILDPIEDGLNIFEVKESVDIILAKLTDVQG